MNSMNGLAKAAVVVFLSGIAASGLSAQTADIGQLRLTGPNFGYQTIGLYNYTGATDGCEQLGAQYNVCNAVNISSWQLTITFTSSVSGIAPSPLVFTSNGAGDMVGPTNSSFDAYTGEAGNPWTLSYSLTNANCSPSCDAKISSITFSGTLDTNTLQLYNGSASGPYTLDSLGSQNFSVTWTIPANDYTANPGSLYDATDIIISNQTVLTPQTITFAPLMTQTLGTAAPALSASASSGLMVSFTSNSLSVCTVSGTSVTLVAAGTCSITATQPGDSTYAAATPVTQTFTLNQASQTISFAPINTMQLSSGSFSINVTADSGLAVDLTANTLSVCTLSGNTVTLVALGTCSITATQTGNTIFAGAAPVTQAFLVTNLMTQSITFGPIATQVVSSTPVPLSASATSGLAIVFSSNTPGVCTVSAGPSVIASAVGTCSIAASQSGNGTYAAATPISQSFTVTQGANVITFGPIGTQTLDSSPTLSATATSGLAVMFASTTTNVCTVNGNTVTLSATGTCSITASQPGNANYVAATSVMQSFTVTNASSGGGGGGGSGGGGGGGGSTGGGTPLTISPSSVTINASLNGQPGTQTVTLSYQTFTQGAPSFSSNFSTNQGQGWLSVSPASGTMTQASLAGLLYTYTATVTIQVDSTGIPGGSSYTGTVNFTSAGSILSLPVTMNVLAQATKYTVAPQSLSFSYQQGSTIQPQAQSISVFSTPLGGSFTATASSTGNWLAIASATSALTTPSSIGVSVNISGLAPGTYSGNVTIASGNSVSIVVPVTLTVVKANPPVLSVAPVLETFSLPQSGAASGGQVTVSNTGGGTLQFTSQAVSDQGWLKIAGSGSGSVTASLSASLGFTVNPGNLKPGLYNGAITISESNSAAQTTVKVVLTVTNPAGQIRLSDSGLSLTAIAGGAAPQSKTFAVANAGMGSLSWSAQASTSSGGNWLTVSPASGTSIGGQAGAPVTVSANIAGLAAGRYYGSINVIAGTAVNSPQSVSVVLNVIPALPAASVLVSTGGAILIGAPGSTTPVTQSVGFFNLSSSAVTYSASAFTLSGGNWLSVSPASGSVNPGASSIQISADFSKLPAGFQAGQVTLGFGDGSTASIQVFALIIPGGKPLSNLRPAAVEPPRAMATPAACSGGNASFLIPIFHSPATQSTVQVSAATTIQAEVVDDCGHAVTAAAGGAVQVTFSNGDPGIDLNDIGSGIWEGTWTPQNASASASLQMTATEGSLTSGSSPLNSSLAVAVTAAAAGSAPQPTGIANAASAGQATPQIVSPGSYIAIYGTNLAGSGNPNATSLPLPMSLNGTQLFLGGLPMPLLYAASGQVNALVPQGIMPNATYPLVVVQGNAQSVPVPITIAELQPGQYTVNTSGSGAGIVTNAKTAALISASNPAHAGDFLVIYGTGLGSLTGTNGETEPADGAAAPTTTVYHTTAQITVTIGGVNAPVTFSGLTPTLAGLYQVNVQMPSGVAPGTAIPVVITAMDAQTGATAVSNTVTIAVQ
jgi:uncharacterized protein (TIGR03437 family)